MSIKNNTDEPRSLAERRTELDAILRELEQGSVPIERVTQQLKAAAELADSIEQDLRKQKASVEVLKQRFDTET